MILRKIDPYYGVGWSVPCFFFFILAVFAGVQVLKGRLLYNIYSSPLFLFPEP